MIKNLGGMEFRPGRPIRLSKPPEHLPAEPIQLWCAGRAQVTVGQAVQQGHRFSEGQTSDICPIAGTVTGLLRTGPGPHHPGEGFWVTIEPSGQSMSTVLPVEPPHHRTIDDWLATMTQMCPWGTRDGHVGLVSQLVASRKRRPDTLICVALDSYPPYPVRSSLAMSYPDDVVLGTLIVADVVGAKRTVMLASKAPRVLAKLRPSCRNFQLTLNVRQSVYPSADPTLVVRAFSQGRRRLLVGTNPVENVGMMLINPWTAIRVARWFTRRRFDLAQPIMVGWARPGLSMTHHYALAGQALSSLNPGLKDALRCGDTVILGNPMADSPACLASAVGQPPNSAAVVPNDQLLVTVLGSVSKPRPEPCISCGWCVEICPTGLRPNRLWEDCGRDLPNHYVATHLPWCIDCGLCSHVCPSSLPLAQTFGQTKKTMAMAQIHSTAAL